ncbi:hypothetical protein AV530_005025 [Patagioenas fasciata monilis]|uniref:Uncharacterized protein n=1 Tax=Patagioenas fasciata monilis TaxID=372326 RepID=A0A1V4K3P0_PATFA|nr:hypothetical protein AV530_005025 [Patagioenas fasciata monilis]
MAFSFMEVRGADTDISNSQRRGGPGHTGCWRGRSSSACRPQLCLPSTWDTRPSAPSTQEAVSHTHPTSASSVIETSVAGNIPNSPATSRLLTISNVPKGLIISSHDYSYR